MSRKLFKLFAALGVFIFAAALSGCGSDNKDGVGAVGNVDRVNDATCYASACHDAQRSRVTAVSIVDTYRQSAHAVNKRVGCQDCHGGGSQHYGKGPLPYPDPAKDGAQGQCWTCHGTGSHTLVGTAHFNTSTGDANAVYNAMYMSKNFADCKNCHNPHNPDPGQEHKDWALNHGKVDATAFADEDFKQNASCVRCHTATGFISFVSHFTVPTSAWGTSSDPTREVIVCAACHTSYDFKNSVRRTGGGVVAPYYKQFATTTKVTYPDVGASNLCISCHSGRQSGGSIALITNFANASVPTPHYLTSAEVFFGLGGYSFYPDYSFYYFTGYNAGADTGSWEHGTLGVAVPVTGQPLISGGISTGLNGPCVACHLGNQGLNANGDNNPKSHTFNPNIVANWTKGKTPTATGAGCYGCHGTEDMVVVGEEEKALFDADMDFFKFTLSERGIYYNSSRPNFRNGTSSTATEIKNWTAVSPTGGNGKDTMGAAFNYYLLSHDPGLHVHNRAYARLLIFDSIQYLQKGAVTYSNRAGSTTAASTTTTTYYVGGVAKSFNIIRQGGVADPNGQISFTAYSTARAAGTTWTRPNSVTIAQMRDHLTRNLNGLYYRR